MKKIFSAVLVLLVLVSLPVFAEEMQKKDMPGMCCKGMGGKANLIATDDGGVILLVGNKLSKYDADLNLVKEVEIAMPMGGKNCPMMKAMGKGETSEAEAGKKPV